MIVPPKLRDANPDMTYVRCSGCDNPIATRIAVAKTAKGNKFRDCSVGPCRFCGRTTPFQESDVFYADGTYLE